MKWLHVFSILVPLMPVNLLAWFPGLDENSGSETVCQNALFYSIGNVVSEPSSPPYQIVLDHPSWLPGKPMKVQIKGTGSHKIQGVILQMRNLRTQFSVGHIEGVKDSKLYNCDGKNDTILYWSDSPQNEVTLMWKEPSDKEKTLHFVANIFENSNTLWPNVSSDALDKGFPPIDVSGCGKTKGCVRYNPGKTRCTAEECLYLLTYKVQNEMVEFEMSGEADWIAVGFSSDELMGGDDVLMCQQDGGRGAAVNHYITNPNYMGVNLMEGRAIMSPETEIVNGRLNCRFTRQLKVPRDETYADLNNDCFHLYAWGDKSVAGGITKHTLDSPPTSGRKLNLLMSPVDIISGTSGSPVSSQVLYIAALYCVYHLYI